MAESLATGRGGAVIEGCCAAEAAEAAEVAAVSAGRPMNPTPTKARAGKIRRPSRELVLPGAGGWKAARVGEAASEPGPETLSAG